MTIDNLLVRLLGAPDLPPHLLTYAAEAVACIDDPSDDLVDALIRTLQHPKAYVREGALLGCASLLGRARVREAVEAVAVSADPILVEVARDLLCSTPDGDLP